MKRPRRSDPHHSPCKASQWRSNAVIAQAKNSQPKTFKSANWALQSNGLWLAKQIFIYSNHLFFLTKTVHSIKHQWILFLLQKMALLQTSFNNCSGACFTWRPTLRRNLGSSFTSIWDSRTPSSRKWWRTRSS